VLCSAVQCRGWVVWQRALMNTHVLAWGWVIWSLFGGQQRRRRGALGRLREWALTKGMAKEKCFTFRVCPSCRTVQSRTKYGVRVRGNNMHVPNAVLAAEAELLPKTGACCSSWLTTGQHSLLSPTTFADLKHLLM
jgi:hypothetical protein